MRAIVDFVGMLMIITIWITVIAICLFAIYLMGSIALRFYYEYLIKIWLQAELLKAKIKELGGKNE